MIRKISKGFWSMASSSCCSSNCARTGCESGAKHAEAVWEIRLFWLGCSVPLGELTPSHKQTAEYSRVVGGGTKVDSIKSWLLSCTQLCRKCAWKEL